MFSKVITDIKLHQKELKPIWVVRKPVWVVINEIKS